MSKRSFRTLHPSRYATISLMARRRFFVDRFQKGAAVIEGDEAAHLTRVLRVEKGQQFEISDNSEVWLATVTEARKSLVAFELVEPMEAGPAAAPVDLYAALFKFDRFEWMIEKATELGVRRVIPVETRRSEQGLFAAAEKRVERWRRIAREASQQSRRAQLPEIAAAIRFRELPRDGERVLLDELQGTPTLQIKASPVALLAGPEGGWTDDERENLRANCWTAASLGATVLRAETAAIAGLAVVIHDLAGLTHRQTDTLKS